MHGYEFQSASMRTRNRELSDSESLTNAVMGLAGEAGECADLMKKHLFQGHDLDEENMIDEMGDVLWYIALGAEALHTTIDDIMLHNLEKLRARYPEGFDPERSINRNS